MGVINQCIFYYFCPAYSKIFRKSGVKSLGPWEDARCYPNQQRNSPETPEQLTELQRCEREGINKRTVKARDFFPGVGITTL